MDLKIPTESPNIQLSNKLGPMPLTAILTEILFRASCPMGGSPLVIIGIIIIFLPFLFQSYRKYYWSDCAQIWPMHSYLPEVVPPKSLATLAIN